MPLLSLQQLLDPLQLTGHGCRDVGPGKELVFLIWKRKRTEIVVEKNFP
jgi:hypothetical protein